MIVTMKENIKPQCDRHFWPMELTGFEATNTRLHFRAYACKAPGCTRAYNSSSGYHDIRMDTGVSFAAQVRRECPDDQTYMFISAVNPESGDQTWTCAQVHCDHSEVVKSLRDAELRERVAAVLKSAYPDWMSMKQISDKVGTEIGPYSRILGPMEADGEIEPYGGEPESGIVRWKQETFEIVTNAAPFLDPTA